MPTIRELLHLGPSKNAKNERLREPARRVMDEAGGRASMIELATELRQNGDASAIVDEHRVNFWPDLDIATLRFDLKTSNTYTMWQSKAVRIVAHGDGRTNVQYGDGWPQLSQDDIKRRGHPKRLDEMSLEEKVRFAMGITYYSTDYRFGEGKRSAKGKPVKSSISRQIF